MKTTPTRTVESYKIMRASKAGGPVDRARATFYRSNFAFGGKVRSGGFQVSFTGRDLIKEVSRHNNLLRRFKMIGDFWMRTVIENLHYQDCIRIYGKTKNAVLYFDPPYIGTEGYYSHRFTTADHAFLAQQITDCPAPAVGSYYDHPRIRELYSERRWRYHTVEQTKNSNDNIKLRKEKVQELILVKRMEDDENIQHPESRRRRTEHNAIPARLRES